MSISPAVTAAVAGLAVLSVVAGCVSEGRAPGPQAAPVAVNDQGLGPELERAYLIGPAAARQLGYRIHFQARTRPDAGAGIKIVTQRGDSVFVLDGNNFLSRLRRDDGERLWRVPVADPLDEVSGVTYLPEVDRVYVTAGGNLFALDRTTGSLMSKQQLGQIASTRPVVFGPFLIYGARNGQVVWHSYEVGYQYRGYQVSEAMWLPPLLVDGSIVAIGSDGRVMVLDAPTGAGIWDKRLLNAVVAPPAAGHGLLYVSGLDQYLWALDLGTGRTAWKYLAETPLEMPPVVIGEHVFQYIPAEGLVCFEARPVNSPGGVRTWAAEGVRGRVVGRIDDRLLTWDDTARRVTVLDAPRGSVVTTVDLPDVSHIAVDPPDGGDIFAAGNDGRVIRLVPRT